MLGPADRKSIFSLKSWLFTPGTKANRFHRAAEVYANALIIDLEDSVAPRSKSEARDAAVKYLANIGENHLPCALRINPPHSNIGFEDLRALLGSAAEPDYVVLPKCDSAGTISLVQSLLRQAGKSTDIIALIESAGGLAVLEELSSLHPRPAALVFGAADMAADLGAEPSWEPLLYSRSRIIQVAALAGIAALDGPYFDLSDEAGLRKETKASASLGFHGKCAIHPAQIQTINEVLTPTKEEVDLARRVLAVNQRGVASLDHKMVDEAIARRARLILARAGVAAS